MSEAPSRAQENSPGEWERIKRRFCDLYLGDKKTLAKVREILEEEDFAPTERQYKRKIKLWNLRKNANAGDYSHIDRLIQSPSAVPLGDVFMSQGIPITDKKLHKYVRRKGQKAPATTYGQVSPPPDHSGCPSARPPLADEMSLEPDQDCSPGALTEISKTLKVRDVEVFQLQVKLDAERLEGSIRHLMGLIRSQDALFEQHLSATAGNLVDLQRQIVLHLESMPPFPSPL